jgi:25S rRNA (uracil2634-N3)-methyltransferase
LSEESYLTQPGAGITDQDRNILSNQTLLLRTLRSVYPILTDGPSAFPLSFDPRLKGKGKGGGKGKSGKQPIKRKRSESEDEGDDDNDDGIDWADEDPSLGDLNPRDDAIRSITSTFNPPKREGSILITLLDQPPYTLWDLKRLASRPPSTCPGTHLAQPKYRLLRSFAFDPVTYPGYAHRRTIGWKEGVSKSGNEEIVGRKGRARTWEFARAPEE